MQACRVNEDLGWDGAEKLCRRVWKTTLARHLSGFWIDLRCTGGGMVDLKCTPMRNGTLVQDP